MSYEVWGEPPDSPFDAAMEAGWIDPIDISKATIDVMNERDRQCNEEGFLPTHDDKYVKGELPLAAACYVFQAGIVTNLVSEGRIKNNAEDYGTTKTPELWPWDSVWWKPTSPRKDLVRAAALIIAEIERLDRADIAATI